MDMFLMFLEENCPGDDAHDGMGDPRPLIERCGMCASIYEAHLNACLQGGLVTRKAGQIAAEIVSGTLAGFVPIEVAILRHAEECLKIAIRTAPAPACVEREARCDASSPACATHAGKKASCDEPLPCKYHSSCETCGHGGLAHTDGFGCRWYGCGCSAMKTSTEKTDARFRAWDGIGLGYVGPTH